MADFIYPSNFILKGLYQNLCLNLEKNIPQKLKGSNNAVDSVLCKDFITLFSGFDQEHVPPFMKLFWEEQQKYLPSSS